MPFIYKDLKPKVESVYDNIYPKKKNTKNICHFNRQYYKNELLNLSNSLFKNTKNDERVQNTTRKVKKSEALIHKSALSERFHFT